MAKIRVNGRSSVFYCTGAQCCGSGSGIRSLFDPWIRKLEKVKKVVNFGYYEDTNGMQSSTFYIFQLLCMKSMLRIRDTGWGKSGSGINILDPLHCWYKNQNPVPCTIPKKQDSDTAHGRLMTCPSQRMKGH